MYIFSLSTIMYMLVVSLAKFSVKLSHKSNFQRWWCPTHQTSRAVFLAREDL